MFGLSRRAVLSGLTYAAAGQRVTAGTIPAGSSPAGSYTNVRDFGAQGDGTSDDTRAIQAAIAAAPPGGTVWFPAGTYLVSKTLVLRRGSTYRGSNPESSIIRQKRGANLVAVMADENFTQDGLRPTIGIQVEDLGIDGNAHGNQRGHGLVLMTERSLVRHVIVSFTPQAGIVLSDQNSRGAVVRYNAVENRVEACTVIEPGTFGIWVRDTHSSGRQTDGYLIDNVVTYCLGTFAMRIERAAGWFIADNHVYHCSNNGIFLGHATGTFLSANEVDKFGLTKMPPGSYYGLQVQFLMGRFRPSFFIGNICATPEGLNPYNSYTYFDLVGDKFGTSSVVLIGNAAHNDPVGSPPHAHKAAASVAFAYNTQPGGTMDVSAVANISDGVTTQQAIPKGAKIRLPAPAPGHTPIAAGAVAGAAGGAVISGLGMTTFRRQARKQVDTQLSAGHPAPSYRESIVFIDVAETLNRWEVDSLSSAPDVDSIHLTYFVPYRPIEVTQITSATGDVAAAGAALSKAGVYEVLETGELRILGSTRKDGGELWTVPNSLTTAELDPACGSVPLLLLAGKPYAYAEIQVGGSPATRVGKAGNPSLMALEPRASAKYPGYTDLPRTLPRPSPENASGLQLYARLSAAHGDAPGEFASSAEGAHQR